MGPIENTADFYYKIAAALSFEGKKRHFDSSEIITVEVDGETYDVGPFENVDYQNMGFSGEGAAMFSFPDTDFAVGMGDDNWSSWGHMYDDEGNPFNVYKKANKRVVYDYDTVYDFSKEVVESNPFPRYGNRW